MKVELSGPVCFTPLKLKIEIATDLKNACETKWVVKVDIFAVHSISRASSVHLSAPLTTSLRVLHPAPVWQYLLRRVKVGDRDRNYWISVSVHRAFRCLLMCHCCCALYEKEAQTPHIKSKLLQLPSLFKIPYSCLIKYLASPVFFILVSSSIISPFVFVFSIAFCLSLSHCISLPLTATFCIFVI